MHVVIIGGGIAGPSLAKNRNERGLSSRACESVPGVEAAIGARPVDNPDDRITRDEPRARSDSCRAVAGFTLQDTK